MEDEYATLRLQVIAELKNRAMDARLRKAAMADACRCMKNGEDGINWSCPVVHA
jgi:hypothetical protein